MLSDGENLEPLCGYVLVADIALGIFRSTNITLHSSKTVGNICQDVA